LLQSGKVRYKANDAGRRTSEVSNCIHAIGSLSQGYRLRVASPGWGQSASYFILQELEPWIIEIGCNHRWVGHALGLDQYPLIYRDYQNPRSAAIGGPIYRLFGGERTCGDVRSAGAMSLWTRPGRRRAESTMGTGFAAPCRARRFLAAEETGPRVIAACRLR